MGTSQMERYDARVRMVAQHAEDGDTFTQYILDDISSKYEKTVLAKLIRKYESDVAFFETGGADTDREQRILRVLKGRQAYVLEHCKPVKL